jgi:CHAT domain-containing protein/Tfp pilus assembly protein PilF
LFNQNTPFFRPQNQCLPIIRRAIRTLIWAGLSAPLCLWPSPPHAQVNDSERSGSQGSQEIVSLELSKPIERELSDRLLHLYKVTMTTDQFLRVVVKQQGIDVTVALLTPDGKKISEANIDHLTEGSETVSVISESAGAYLIEVRSAEKTAKAGRYEIKVEELRVATAEDKYRVTGDAIFREAEQLRNGALEAKRKSVEKYHEALDLYRKAGNHNGEAETLNNIGVVYRSLGETLKALEKFNEALLLFHTAGDRRGEAETLNNIGLTYNSLGGTRKALEKFNEALPLRRAVGDRHGEAVTLTSIGIAYHLLGETQNALEKYNEALPLRRAVGDRHGEAETLNNIGVVYRLLGETQKALEKFNEALPLRRAVGDRNGEAITLNSIGEAYRILGETQKALEKFNEALPIFQTLGNRRMEAVTLNSIGLANQSLGEMQKALEKHNEALPIFRAIGDRRGEVATLNNLGALYQSLGEMQKALEKHNEALPIFRAIGDRRGEATTLNNIGSVYQSLGEMQKALENFNYTLPIFRAIGDRRGEATTFNNIGSVYRSLGETQKALMNFSDTLQIFRAVGDRPGEAQTLNNIGTVYQSLGETQKALENFNDILPLRRASGDRNGEAQTLNNIGTVYQSLGEKQKALEKYNEALPIFRVVGNRSGEAQTLNNIGTVYLSLGEMQKALENYNDALPLRRVVGDRNGEAATLLGIARVEQKRGDLIQARQTIEQAVVMIELLRTNPNSQELRASYFASHQDLYQSHIDILMKMHKQNPEAAFNAAAFAVSERARARLLLELLTEARADIRQGVDSSLLELERSLRQRLNARAAAQERLLSRKHTPEQAGVAAKEIASITDEYEELRAQIRASSPRYDALTQPRPLNLAEIQQQALDPDTLLLEYSLGDNVSHLFVVSQTSIASYQLPKRDEIEAAARRVREMLTAPQPRPGEAEAKRQARIKEARANYWPQAAALSQTLLGPAASHLGSKRLLIVADGGLHNLPFGALPVPGRQTSTTSSLKFTPTPLIVEHEIVHSPSASALALLRRELAGRQPAAKAVAVFADPVFSPDDMRVKPGGKAPDGKEIPSDMTRATGDLRGELKRLLMTRDEAEAILSATPRNDGFAALDFRANRATATSGALGDYRIVHFATHGLLNDEHPELSGLVLSLVDEQGRPQDGFLRMHEIFNLRLPAELVVLSACQTGLGKEIKGEGLVGLTRGFMYAGAARVVASLWEVNDVATAELMKRFYRHMLQDRMRPAAALRSAQIEMWKRPQWQSPFYWGGFILQGEWK